MKAVIRHGPANLVLSQLWSGPVDIKRRIMGVYALLIGANMAAWIGAGISFHGYPLLLWNALLAYLFGLRHAVDADHIAAIDNVTRKLMQQGQRPVGVGLYFSLGHSTIVFGLSLAIALTSAVLAHHFHHLEEVGGLIGTSVSAFFLLAIALANLFVLISLYRTFKAVNNGGDYVEEDIDLMLAKRGFFGHIFRQLFQLMGKSWHMYPLGFLFGLGFDTATEVGLLGISAAEASKGLSIWSILIFPALFTAGMALVDTTDGILMLGAYGWAFIKPVRKLYYNITITFVSVVVALLIGSIEVFGLIDDQFKLQGNFWNIIERLNNSFGMLGLFIVSVFIATWIGSILIYRKSHYDGVNASAGPAT